MATFSNLRETINVMAGLAEFHDFALNEEVAFRSLEFIDFLEHVKATVPKLLPESDHEITFTWDKDFYVTITDNEDDYISILNMRKKLTQND